MSARCSVAAKEYENDFSAAINVWTGKAIVDETVVDARSLMASLAEFRSNLFDIGIQQGDLVFVAGGQHLDTLATVAAAIDLGALAVPVSPLMAPAMLDELIASCGPVGIVVTRERVKAVARAFTGQLSEMSGSRLTFLAAPNPARRAAPVGCLGLISSGTTGTPKIITHLPQNALHNARLHAKLIGLGRSDRLLMTLPMHFSFGFVACVLGCINSGADIVIKEPAMTAAVFVSMVEATTATVYSATPAMLRRVLPERHLPQSLRILSVGGDAMPADEVERVRAQFDGRFYLTYGLSEAGPRAFTREVLHGEVAPFDLGVPLAGIEYRLGALPLDHLFEVPTGHRMGELQLRTPTATMGLWERSGITRRDFDGNWLRTGDIVVEAPDGKLFYSDRIKNIIVSGGEKISSGLIRRVLLEHEDVVAAKIWAEPDVVLGQIPIASVRLRDDRGTHEAAILADIQAWNSKRLRRIERPRRIISDKTLPIVLK